ncbi:Multidrug and toxin extrusion protein 1 [Hibiscus syriacus]|uniref:Multidrug and toxin extrusion protein 1 n=1 Tax=Hibiscus syriacus TaxID=106335 RepID=A0A6A3CND1_HIBSY|nr:Multidrug and toxin extrusion protein 1 [Hibiscus syriacus]
MVGLSVVLENQNSSSNIISQKNPQVISKTSMLITTATSGKVSFINPPSNYAVPPFLQQCFLCKQNLLPAQDIYVPVRDRGFCSVECRCRQILMDEEETLKKPNCSFAAMKPSSSASRRRRETGRSRAGGSGY